MGSLESILKSLNIRALDSCDYGIGYQTLGFYPFFVPLLDPREEEKEEEWRIFTQSMGARNRLRIGLSYRPTRLHSLMEWVPWNPSLKV
jgi:hypothetical protein